MGRCINLKELKPTLLMVMVQTVFSIVNICYKLAANDGMNLSVLVGYRFLFGATFIVPVALFAERKKRPKLTGKIIFYAFLCGLFGGSLGQNLYVKGLVLTSATFASAMTNLIPAITFVVALSLRLERLGWNTAAGKAKVFGTMVGIGGAMIITFYKGKELDPWDTHINLLQTTSTHQHPSGLPHNKHGGPRYILGAVLSLASCLCYSLWLITQAKAAELYPCPYSITAMMAVAATLQGIAFALTVDSNWNQWNLGWNIRLFTVAFSGIFASGLMFSVVAWCVRARGPLFVSIFQPLMLVLVGLMGSLFLEEKLHVGLVIGAVFIVTGLYIVLWGKQKEVRSTPEADVTTANTADEAERTDTPPPPLPALPQNGSSLNNNEIRAEEGEVEAEVEVEEETHIDIPPPPLPPLPPKISSSHSNRESMTVEELAAEVEEETHIDIPAPPPPPLLQKVSSRSNKGRRAEEEVAYEDMVPPSKYGSSHSKSGGRMATEVDRKLELPLPSSQPKNSSHSSSSSGEQGPAEVNSQTASSDSCSDGRVESQRRKDLTPSSQSSKDSEVETETETEAQSGGSRNIKEVEVDVELEVETRRSVSSHSRNGSRDSSRKEVEVEVGKRGKEKRD